MSHRRAVRSCDVKEIALLTVISAAEERDALIKSIALLKRNALAAPFERAFQAQKSLESQTEGTADLMAIHYRDEEAIYVQAAHDRVTVVFSTVFREETDRIFGKVFLQVWVISSTRVYMAHALPRNLLMLGDFLLFRTPHKCFTLAETLLSKSVT